VSKTPKAAKLAKAETRPDLPLFYKRPRPLQAARDADSSLATGQGYGFAAGANATPLAAGEMTQACRHYPILFVDGPTPHSVALLGLRSGENLFVDEDGAWESGVYIPLYVRRYPFIFLENADKSEFSLCIDEAAPGFGQGGAGRLFDKGEPTALTRNALEFCRDFQGHLNFTAEFMKAVAAADLLIDNRADVTLNDGRRLSLAGFQIIDEARFNALPDDDFLRWRAKGWLHLVYCHFISTGNWGGLVDRAAKRGA
jgi:hypothetical protein